MATPKFNSKSPTIRRILREAQELSSSPSADYTAVPLENDLFEWHFTLKGPPSSAFAGGIYHGRIVLPAMYPLRPPSFRFVTPSGRFETNREICLSISGHHEETWQPAWGVRTALVALRSFMETDSKGQLGGLETTDEVRRRLATESKGFRCSVCAKTNGEIMEECEKAAQEYEAASGGSGSSKASAEEVPSELKLAWRDELEGAASKKADGSGAATTTPPTTNPAHAPIPQPGPTEQTLQNDDDYDSETDELTEGFIPTDPLDSISRYDGVRVPRRRAVFAQQPEATSQQASSSSSQEQQRQPGVPPRGPAQLTPPFPIPPSRVNPQQIPAMMIQRQQERLQRERQAAAAASYREDPINVRVDRLIVILGVLLAALIIKVILF
ncbi:ubiquitin-conjugating enzyme/RWD-like protein [Rhypophila decipiens]|uniref:Ubiquitin-conjugating enzyme/RWD-like protein n=1 Tax=Rhypophila decipiens TaxID=261697 RepID=A0AAN6YKW4_9PEZI|nr:ubiquitin-conjugating enzyme/RWD-like protein [Rhypophila decipiens]